MKSLISQKGAPLFLCSIVLGLLSICSCKKSKQSPQAPVYHISEALKSDFGYKPGSYWIYKDSTTGDIDSAYVVSNELSNVRVGCVYNSTTPFREQMLYSIKVIDIFSESTLDAEQWNVLLTDSTMTIRLSSTRDTLESREYGTLAKYPFKTGSYNVYAGCVYPELTDSAAVTEIIPSFAVNNLQFPNTALSAHAPKWFPTAPAHYYYNDRFYLSPGVGLVKVVFNHPVQSVNRVLELERYHIVN